MRRAKSFSTVNWKKYLDINENPRAKSFLESRGDTVLEQISYQIFDANQNKKNELILLVHPNAGAVIRIQRKDFYEVMDICLKWFEYREDYNICKRIQTRINLMKNGNKLKEKTNKQLI